MKNFTKLFLFCISIISCEKNTEILSTIEGKWNVTQIIGGFAQPKTYKTGSFTWDFNFEENTITIINIAQPFNSLLTPTFINDQGGIYNFSIETENDITYLVVGDRKGTITLNDKNLTIDYGIAFDDIAYIFKR